MTFKHCNYYDSSMNQGHCPFDKVCDKNCYFTYEQLVEDFKQLQHDYEEMENEYEWCEDCEEELDELKDDYASLQEQCIDMISLIKHTITELNKFTSVDVSILDDIDTFGPEWKHEIAHFIKGLKMNDLKIVCKADRYLPQYANETDACMDLKIVVDDEARPEKWFNNMNYYSDANQCWLFPGEKRLFGTGVQVAVPEDHVMLLYPRSSTGSKLNIMLANTTGVIDTGYRDEVKLCLVNYGNEPVKLEDAQRIAQFMIIPRPKINLCVVKDNDEFRNGDRGGGFGSTGA